MKVFFFLLLLPVSYAQTSLAEKIKLISDNNIDLKVMAVVYNSADGDLSIPPSVGKIRIVKMPFSNPREIGTTLAQGVLEKYSIQALFLVDDGKKMITKAATVKFFMKQGLKYNYTTYTDAQELEVKVTGSIRTDGGKLSIELAEEKTGN